MWLKQSTAVVISFGPFVDQSDGVTSEVGLVTALDHASTGIKLSKNGGALTIRHAAVTASTYDDYGNYRVTLDTTDTNTLGTLRMQFADATTNLPVWQDFMVVTANVWDSMFGADLLQTDLQQWIGVVPLALSSQQVQAVVPVTQKVDVETIKTNAVVNAGTVTFPANATLASTTNITAGTITTATNVTTVNGLAANVITAASMDADAGAEIASAVWKDTTAGDFTVAGSIGKSLFTAGAVPGAAGGLFIAGANAATTVNVTGNITGNLSGSVGSVSGNVTGSVGSIAAGGIAAASFAAGAIDATAIATNAIDADAIAASAVTELRSIVSGTSDSGTGTTMVDAARTEADADYWKDSWILFTSGTIAGQVRLITAFDEATDTITFTPATTQVVGTQTYEILPAASSPATVSGTVDANLISIDGQVTTGNNATLKLKQLSVINSAGNAIVATSTGGDGDGIQATGDGTGHGIHAQASLGNGIVVESSDGNAIYASASGSGPTVYFSNAGTGHALSCSATDGDGINAAGGTNGDGMQLTHAGSGKDLNATTTPLTLAKTTNITGFNDLSAANVNAEVVDCLNVDTYAEIGQEAPAATNTIRKMLGYLFKAWRNRSTQTATDYKLYNDDAATVGQKSACSDDTVTFDRGEIASGP